MDTRTWAKVDWPCEFDALSRATVTPVSQLTSETRGQTLCFLQGGQLDRHFEVFAHRCGRNAEAREDFLWAYAALRLCRSKEAILISRALDNAAKLHGFSPRKLARQARDMFTEGVP